MDVEGRKLPKTKKEAKTAEALTRETKFESRQLGLSSVYFILIFLSVFIDYLFTSLQKDFS